MKKNIFYYNVYGLNIKSEIYINEFELTQSRYKDESIVSIELGEISNNIDLNEKEEDYYSQNTVVFHINNIASYYIANGDRIIVEPHNNCNSQLLKVFIMCSCLGFIMIQRKKIAIHGGGVVINNKGIILTGERGAGKSTLTTALRLRGYKFIADDVVATDFNDISMVNPAFPVQKLCEDVMDNMKYDKRLYKYFDADGKKKYIVPVEEYFIQNNIKLHSICELSVGNVEDVKVVEIKGREKLKKVIKNIYRGEYIRNMGGAQSEYIKKCIDVAQNIKFYKIVRPEDKFTVEQQIKEIEKLFDYSA